MDAQPRHTVGIVLGVIQLVFTLTWTVYVIFLPALAAEAGIPKNFVVVILLLDQVVFTVTDYATGVAADRVSRLFGRLAHIIVAVTVLSSVAFLLLPYVARQNIPALLLILILLWAVTSSALRAPPLVLLGKYSPQAAVPWLTALSLFGVGLAGAVSPYVTIALRDVDARIPFIASSVALALATLGIVWAERALKAGAAVQQTRRAITVPTRPAIGFMVAVLLVGLGFQIHFSLNSAKLYQRLARPDELQYLMPVFWIGFNALMLPASAVTRRYGGLAVASCGALVSALAALAAVMATDLTTLVVLQFVAGGGWGCVLMSAVSAAIALGHTGREGKLTGTLFSLLALAAFIRIGVVAMELNKDPDIATLLTWAPAIAWGGGGLVLLFLVTARRRMATPAVA